MYPEGAQRLVRRDWSAIGLDYLKGPPENWTPQMVGAAVNGMAVGLQQLMEEMSLLLGSRWIPVAHGYPVKFTDSLPAGATDAVLEVANYPIPPLDNDSTLAELSESNGYAFKVSNGAACFDGPVCFEGQVTGIAGNGGVNCWGKVLVNGAAADTTVGHVLGTVGTWESYVDVTPVTDKTGATATGEPTTRVYLWRDHMTDPNLRVNDVIQFFKDEGGVAGTYAGRDRKLGEKMSRYDVADPTSPIDYTATYGHRGYRVMDGTNGTQDLGGQVEYGWVTGGGTFGTVGGDISNSSAGTISSHAAAGGGPASVTVSIAAAGGGPVTTAVQVTGITIGTFQPIDTDGLGAGTGGDVTFASGTVAEPNGGTGHSHTLTHSSIAAALTGSGTIAHSAVAAALADHTFTGGTVRPAGQVALILQRVT